MTKKFLKYLKAFAKILLGLLLLLILALVALRLFFPRLDQYKPQVEQWAQAALHQPVTIEKMEATWTSLYPRVRMDNLTIGHNDEIKIKYLALGVDILSSLLQRRFIPGAIIVSGTQLNIDHPDANTLMINGLAFDFKDEENNPQKDLKAGNLKLSFRDLDITLPAWFDRSFKLDRVRGRIKWLQTEESLTIHVSKIHLSDAYVDLKADLKLLIPAESAHVSSPEVLDESRHSVSDGGSPYMKLDAHFTEQDASHLRDYLPTDLLASLPALHTWLKEAFVSGDSVTGEIQFQGQLANFPFDDNSGSFTANVHVKNMLFNYKTGWPAINELDAEAIFHNRRLDITAAAGNILGVSTDGATAHIPNLAHADLEVEAKSLETDMQTGLRFIAESPLQKTIGTGLDVLKLQGLMKLDLGLQIPLHDDGNVKVLGDVQILPLGQLNVPDWKIHFTNLHGALRFTESGLYAKELNANWLKEPVVIQIDTTASNNDNTTIQVQLNGHTSTADLQKIYGLEALQEKIKGETDYSATLQINQKGSQRTTKVGIDSNLQGIEIDFPAPLKKSATEKIATHVDIAPQANAGMSVALKYADKFTATATENTNAWRVEINGPAIAGRLTIPHNHGQAIVGNFQRFNLTSASSQSVSNLNPNSIPPLDLQFQNFSYNGKTYGNVSLLTQPGKNSMEIQRLSLRIPNAYLSAIGRWQKTGNNQQVTMLNGELKSKNIGAVLESWGITSSVENGQGNVIFNLTWPASAYDFSAKQLNGNVALDFLKGTIVNISNSSAAEMGVGRILNLLSLQSIPRRLTLDFSDLVQKGFAFDEMKGNFALVNGNATTENAYLQGPIAKVQMTGRIGMGSQDYDLRMIVTPYITSSIPVAATLVGGPIVGAAAWVGNKILGGTVNKIASKTYSVRGTWDKPLIVEVKS